MGEGQVENNISKYEEAQQLPTVSESCAQRRKAAASRRTPN
jgi:hypothetical protein